GLAWEGAWLAGQAASRTTDRRVMSALLTCARALHGNVPGAPDGLPASEATVGARPTPVVAQLSDAEGSGGVPVESTSILSERELEVGRLVVAGLTYKQIGERLFISAKTVEHHVARIRQRLEVTSRNELFDRLRSLAAP
ncbi:MAG: helix-turn-helix transcriptional regulator, partial [Actinobacteria bacterium]|nr:helix-turn-helix transcriptional regulator [Actinomycetota bacterium]